MPAIAFAGASSGLPIGVGGFLAAPVRIDGTPTAVGDEPDHLAFKVVTPGYLETLGVALLRGRHLSDRDTSASQRVALVNRRLATRYWPDGEPVGRTIVMDPGAKNERRITVAGVVADFGREWKGGPPNPQMYVP